MTTTHRPAFGQPSERLLHDEYSAIVERLKMMYPTLEPFEIRVIVDVAAADFEDARLNQFVPLLFEKIARDECRSRGPATPLGLKDPH